MNRRIEKILAVAIPAAILLLFAGLLHESAVPTPVLSVASGFYGEEFVVTMRVPQGCTAYYTIDGTEPNENSERYSSGILIYDRTPEDARFATIDGVSGQEIWSGGGNMYLPSCSIPKATILTVKILDKYGRWSDAVQNFYYVGEDYQKYQNITVVSLAVNPEDLFGKGGIYMNGEEYNSYVDSNDLSRMDDADRIWELANWRKKGENARKEALVSILKDGKIYQSSAKINIAGNTSRIYPQKPFTIRFDSPNDWLILDDNYDNVGNVIRGLSSYKLRNGGSQNQNNFLNDYICQTLSSGLAFDTQAQRPCVLFLNGEYWGIYELAERYDEDYFYSHYGLKKPNNPAMIKSGIHLDLGKEDAKANYDSLVDWIKETDFSKEEAYQELCAKIDADSLVQLYAANIYLTNFDFINTNIACWSYLDSGNSQYVKWKWMMYDTDSTYSDINITSMLELYLEESWLFEKLCHNDQFCYELAEAIRDLQGTVFCPERVDTFIDETINELLPYIEDHYNRVGPANAAALDSAQKEEYFKEYGERIKKFFSKKSREETSSIEAFLAANRWFPVETVWLSGEDWNADQYIATGINWSEGTHTWFDGNEVCFYSCSFGDGSSRTSCRMKLSIGNTMGEQRVIVLVNGEEVYCESINGPEEMIVPFRTDENGSAQISIRLPDAISPKELGASDDGRVLSLDMISILIEEKCLN